MDEVILKVVFKYAVYKTKCVPILFLYVAIVALVYEPRIKSQIGSVLFYGWLLMNRKDKSFLQKNPEMHLKNDEKCTHRKISKNKRLSYQNLAFAGLVQIHFHP